MSNVGLELTCSHFRIPKDSLKTYVYDGKFSLTSVGSLSIRSFQTLFSLVICTMFARGTALSVTLALLCAVFHDLVAASSAPIVTTSQGSLRGTVSEYVSGVNVFKGIRYANSTAGSLRWTHPPGPAKSWSGIINATIFAPECPQIDKSAGNTIVGDEDCLFLNVWTPEGFTNTSNYPVYFWIYGGRFEGGSGSALTYDGSGLAKRGVVVVTINYRLGTLGWLVHPELSAETGYNASGNWGLMDQQAALHWTYENIQYFGGNYSQITVGGQSAGAASSLDMVYSPQAAGLFKGAISESGARAPRDPKLVVLPPVT